ncbi:hypothetical protein QBC36DRAFT_350874 [Triangularia setosa]|uniref:non-specific serine/threonine protein kinase n=1 Tax=Triangularia setosa TaxID=2587417 RepID=A0AAN6VWP2_9PEZI|nr:hypothetical protein QBC36DRAFT_350874 [Podospora setosa]
MKDSPPPIPPSRTPNDDEWRFRTITLPCEWIEDYRPGGYHPVHLGDIFNNGQYKVIRKLGEGSYSTVWLTHDLNCKSCTTLPKVAPVEGGRYIAQLLDEFKRSGPNDIHTCPVFEPMGPSVYTMSLQALVFLHENNIAHGAFQPGNILFVLDDINSMPEDVLQQEQNVQSRSISDLVQRLDGKRDLWAPQYLCVAQPLVPFTPCAEGFKIKLSDMGGGWYDPM